MSTLLHRRRAAKRHRKTAFVLSGGSSWGAVQVGMLRELQRSGVVPDLVVGSSVGAVNGALFASHPNAEGIADLEALWRGVHRRDVFPFSVDSLLRLVRGHDSLIDPAAVRRFLERSFGSTRLEDTRLPMHVVATDVRDGSAVNLCRGRVTDALLASVAIPAILPPVRMDGRLLIDGGVTSNSPVGVASDLGATHILVLPTAMSAGARIEPRGAIALGLHAIRLLLAGQTQMHLRSSVDANVVSVPLPDFDEVSPFDFSRSHELIEAGAAQTRRWLHAGGLRAWMQPNEIALAA